MGYPTDDHIQRFTRGKTVRVIEYTARVGGACAIRFTDGTAVRITPWMEFGKLNLIATPLDANDDVVQSIDIMKQRVPDAAVATEEKVPHLVMHDGKAGVSHWSAHYMMCTPAVFKTWLENNPEWYHVEAGSESYSTAMMLAGDDIREIN